MPVTAWNRVLEKLIGSYLRKPLSLRNETVHYITNVCAFPIPPTRATCSTHLILTFIILIIFDDYFYLFYDIFNDAVSSSECTASQPG
jgi:hypothetical protein